ncbi:MAG: hypothetical protein KC516_01500 [Nanoarchaeota archaeon]|nr:hypothetical protein [Nanoarchaeota archaeon]
MAPDLIGLSEKNYSILSKIADVLNIKYQKGESKIEQIAELDNKNWIRVPQEFSKMNYDFAVSLGRIAYNSAVGEVGKKLGLTLRNTSKDALGRGFVGDINWEKALKLNLMLGNKTTNPLEHFTFLDLINQGAEGKINVYNVKGTKLGQNYLSKIRDDIIKVQSPWRAEWHDADFRFKDNKLYIHFNHDLKNGELIPQNKQLLVRNTLLEDKDPGINLNDNLGDTTKQGLPKTSVKEGDFHYLAPDKDNNSVARSSAYFGGALFSCNWDRSYSDSFLGVRGAKILKD